MVHSSDQREREVWFRSGAVRGTVANGEWRMADGEWQMANGRWQMADGGWQMADGKWRMTDGTWRWWLVEDVTAHFPRCKNRVLPWRCAGVVGRMRSDAWLRLQTALRHRCGRADRLSRCSSETRSNRLAGVRCQARPRGFRGAH